MKKARIAILIGLIVLGTVISASALPPYTNCLHRTYYSSPAKTTIVGVWERDCEGVWHVVFGSATLYFDSIFEPC